MKYRSQRWTSDADLERIMTAYPDRERPVPSTDGVCDDCPHGPHTAWNCPAGITHVTGHGDRCNCPANVQSADLEHAPARTPGFEETVGASIDRLNAFADRWTKR